MEFPEGYDRYLREVLKKYGYHGSTHCLLLKKALYGLVQAACQWYKRITEIFGKLNFHPSPADPCLFVKVQTDREPPAFIILYVDDGAIIGTDKVIKEVIEALSQVVKVKDLGEMKHFVGCHIIESNDSKTIYIHQPKLLKHLEDEFRSKLPTTKRFYGTPGAPKTVIMRPEKGDPLISKIQQTTFRSGVGMLLYLVKHSRPDLANAVRELTKVLDGATQAHWQALMRVIQYTLDTKALALKLQPKMDRKFSLVAYSDSEYAGDRETRASVYGFIVFFCGSPISWKSKSNRSVTLSSTEAEYFACSEAAKELRFIKNIIESMKQDSHLHYPLTLKIDNTGAIFLANNQTTGQRTKNIDIRIHYVRNMITDGIIQTEFVKSEDNGADIFTKNVSENLQNYHINKYMHNLGKEMEGALIIYEEYEETSSDSEDDSFSEYYHYNFWF